MNRPYLVLFTAVVIALLVGFTLGYELKPAPSVQKVEQVTLTLDWIVGGQHAGFYVALDRGYYAAQGISVTIRRGYGSTTTIQNVASGQSQFGWADMGTLIVQRSKGVTVKAVALTYDSSPMSILTRAGTTQSISGLAGHTYAINAGDATLMVFPALAQANNLNPSSVTIQTVDSSAKVSLVIAGKADFTGTMLTDQPGQLAAAAAAGVQLQYFPYATNGVNIYGQCIIASDNLTQQNPDLVRRFVAASLQGQIYAIENPADSVTALQKYVPESVTNTTVATLNVANSYIYTNTTKATGIGVFDAAKVQNTINIIGAAYNLTTPPAASDVYSNDFVVKGQLPTTAGLSPTNIATSSIIFERELFAER